MTFRYDDLDEKIHIGYTQDPAQVERIMERNKRQAIECDPKAQMKNDMIWYASVPTIVQYEWLFKYGLNFHNREHFPKCMDLIDHGDYGYLKTVPLQHKFK